VKGDGSDSLEMEGPFHNARHSDVVSCFASLTLRLRGRHHPNIRSGRAATTWPPSAALL